MTSLIHTIQFWLKQTVFFTLVTSLVISCEERESNTLFQKVDPSHSGIDFINHLEFNEEFNIFTYRNFYNGGGVAIGDINNDGLVDIYFSSNLGDNKLYLNQGNFQFEDITIKARVAGKRAWSTGVCMVDINGDGWLDIYVSNSGNIENGAKENELFINNGDLTFDESAQKFGLDDPGYSTHASFFDFDKDGDLDAYILNNSYEAIGSFNLQRNERPVRDSLGGDKLLRNDNGFFVDISDQAGIYGSIIGFGLGVITGDLNEDGWDDIYVCNDFFERDYLYINQRDGTFKEELTQRMKSISTAAMGADLVDLDNDGSNDLFVTEMLPSSHARLKLVTAFETYDRYIYGLKNGYYHQFPRNTFQKNNGDGTFSELGRMLGIAASDWSWGALFFDMDNDGHRDLFISNGIYQDLTDQDYLEYVSTEEVMKSVLVNGQVSYSRLIEMIPSRPISNHAYLNQGQMNLSEKAKELGLAEPGFSNGAAYGDLDNDGDLDLVINNVNMSSWVYENKSDTLFENHFIKISLKGSVHNSQAIGAKIIVEQGQRTFYLDQQPIRGFQSSMDPRLNLGLPNGLPVNIKIQWPSGGFSELRNVHVDQMIDINQDVIEVNNARNTPPLKSVIFSKTKSPDYTHSENEFIDFDRERLLYHMNSNEGPKMAATDLNGDNVMDIYIGGSKGFPGTILMSGSGGYYVNSHTNSVFEAHKLSEDTKSVFFDGDNDGDMDLYVGSGGVEFTKGSTALKDRYYINQGDGLFVYSEDALPSILDFISTGTVSSADIDGDGDTDLFIGERIELLNYGFPCSGYLLSNNGTGVFNVVKNDGLQGIGMITSSAFADLDQDLDQDLIVTGEFMGVEIYVNDHGHFTKVESNTSDFKGWWRVVKPVDLDGDGDLDLIVGNHGLNSRFKATMTNPIRLYSNDFDQNGFTDPILTGFADDGKEYPYALRHTLVDQLKGLKKKFPDFQSYKDATISDILTNKELQQAYISEVNTLESMIFLNNGSFRFGSNPLPIEAQVSPIYAIDVADFDGDGDVDILVGGNQYAVKPEMGRYDASYGSYLENHSGQLKAVDGGFGFHVYGQIRDIIIDRENVLVSRNNDSLIHFNWSKPINIP